MSDRRILNHNKKRIELKICYEKRKDRQQKGRIDYEEVKLGNAWNRLDCT